MISEKYLNRKKRTEQEISSNMILNQEEKDELIDILNTTLEGTNGLSAEEKLQNVSESVFSLTRLFISNLIKQTKSTSSWRDVIIKCKRELMWLGFGVVALLLFRPEIAKILEKTI